MTTNNAETKVPVKQPAKPRVLGFPDLREEMDRLWDAVMIPTRPFQWLSRTQTLPAMDVFERDGKLHVHTELPGLTDKDVEITADADTLTVSGEKQEKSEVKEDNYYRAERTYGKFSRQVALPAGADINAITAVFKNGVLEIEVPVKAAPAKTKVEIKPSNGK
jgi:HSP20 family protein